MKLFKKKAPVIILDNGPLSSKVVLLGTRGDKFKFGVLQICKYKDGGFHPYGEEITNEKIGEPMVTILFGSVDGIKKMADALYKLHDEMVVD